MDKKALVYSSSIGINETVLEEVGISKYSKMSTLKVAGGDDLMLHHRAS
jgi:aspartate 1-decarboxylase